MVRQNTRVHNIMEPAFHSPRGSSDAAFHALGWPLSPKLRTSSHTASMLQGTHSAGTLLKSAVC